MLMEENSHVDELESMVKTKYQFLDFKYIKLEWKSQCFIILKQVSASGLKPL